MRMWLDLTLLCYTVWLASKKKGKEKKKGRRGERWHQPGARRQEAETLSRVSCGFGGEAAASSLILALLLLRPLSVWHPHATHPRTRHKNILLGCRVPWNAHRSAPLTHTHTFAGRWISSKVSIIKVIFEFNTHVLFLVMKHAGATGLFFNTEHPITANCFYSSVDDLTFQNSRHLWPWLKTRKKHNFF